MEKRDAQIKVTGNKVYVACENCKHGYATEQIIVNHDVVECKKCGSTWQVNIVPDTDEE